MFTHVSEETTRLAHGFLGALFAYLIVMAEGQVGPVIQLCLALYVAFVFNSTILFMFQKIAVENANKYVAWMALLIFVAACLLITVIYAYGFGYGVALDKKHESAIRCALGVYVVFLIVMNMSYLSAVFAKKMRAATVPVPGGARS